MAEPTGLEPATSCVTGMRSNQLNYDSATMLSFLKLSILTDPRNPSRYAFKPTELARLPGIAETNLYKKPKHIATLAITFSGL